MDHADDDEAVNGNDDDVDHDNDEAVDHDDEAVTGYTSPDEHHQAGKLSYNHVLWQLRSTYNMYRCQHVYLSDDGAIAVI